MLTRFFVQEESSTYCLEGKLHNSIYGGMKSGGKRVENEVQRKRIEKGRQELHEVQEERLRRAEELDKGLVAESRGTRGP